jgi:hypothetical protein
VIAVCKQVVNVALIIACVVDAVITGVVDAVTTGVVLAVGVVLVDVVVAVCANTRAGANRKPANVVISNFFINII